MRDCPTLQANKEQPEWCTPALFRPLAFTVQPELLVISLSTYILLFLPPKSHSLTKQKGQPLKTDWSQSLYHYQFLPGVQFSYFFFFYLCHPHKRIDSILKSEQVLMPGSSESKWLLHILQHISNTQPIVSDPGKQVSLPRISSKASCLPHQNRSLLVSFQQPSTNMLDDYLHHTNDSFSISVIKHWRPH